MKQAARHVRHKSGLALILIDVINHFEFPDGKTILRQALPIAPALARLKQRAGERAFPRSMSTTISASGVPTAKLIQYCLRPEARGGPSSNSSGPTTRIISC